MRRRPPRSTLTDTLFPYTTLFLAAIAERLLLSALRTTGVNNPPSTATATPISARAKRNILSSAHAALAAGKAMRAWAYALTTKSLTEILIDPLSFTQIGRAHV